MLDKPFVSWLLINALACVGAYYAWSVGILADALHHDRFFVVSAIFTWYAVASVLTGIASFNVEFKDRAWTDSDPTVIYEKFSWFSTANLLNLGLIGTVYGFIAMLVDAFEGKNFADPNVIQGLLPVIGENWATALYATAAGITLNVALSLQAFALSSGLDRKGIDR